MSNNGKHSTAQTIDGFTIDLNRVTRREFREFLRQLGEAGDTGGGDSVTGDFLERVMTAWPFGDVISLEAYLDLPLLDSKRVDDALTTALEIITKKNSTS